jgi:hypothetical protein
MPMTKAQLREIVIRSLPQANQMTGLFNVVANHIAKAEGQQPAMAGAVGPRHVRTGFMMGENHLEAHEKARVQDIIHDLYREGRIYPGLGDGLNDDWPFYHTPLED